MKKEPKQKKFSPLGSWVQVRVAVDASNTNEHGLIIPAKAEQEQKAFGTVTAIGNDVKDIEVGDEVVYGVYAGEVMKLRENGREVEYKILLYVSEQPDHQDIIGKLV